MSGSTDTGGGVDGSSGAAGGGGVEGRNGDSAAAAAAAAVLGVVLGPALLSGSSMSRIAASWTGCVGACSKEKTTLDSKALPANIAKSKEEMEEGMYIQKDGGRLLQGWQSYARCVSHRNACAVSRQRWLLRIVYAYLPPSCELT